MRRWLPRVLDPNDSFQRLPSTVRNRLEAFAEALDSISTEQLTLLGARPLDSDTHERARAAADEQIQWHGWQEALASIRHSLLQWMVRRFVSMSSRADWGQVGLMRENLRIGDEMRIGQSLADALRAIVVWDEIDEAYRDELLGTWAALIKSGS